MKCRIMLHFMWVFTVCKSTCLGVPRIERVKAYAQNHSLNIHAQVSSGTRCLNFVLSIYLCSFFMFVTSEYSKTGETEPWLLVDK